MVYSFFSKAVATSNDFFKNLKIAIEISEICLSRDVVMFLKVGGPPFSPKNSGGALIGFYTCPAENMGGPGPPGPLDNYIPDHRTKHFGLMGPCWLLPLFVFIRKAIF